MSISRRDFLKLGAAAVVDLFLASCKPLVDGLNAITSTPVKMVDAPTPTEEANVFIPGVERIDPEKKLPGDVISPEDLWRSYHTRIWQGKDTKVFLRPGISEVRIFKDLNARKLESLDIIMFDDECLLNEEQRQRLDPNIVAAFDDYLDRNGKFHSGLLLGVGSKMGIFVRKYSVESDPDDILKSYPTTDGESIGSSSTPAITLRHEFFHYNYAGWSDSPEESVGIDIAQSIQTAQEKFARGDDSGYFVVYEIKDGVVVS